MRVRYVYSIAVFRTQFCSLALPYVIFGCPTRCRHMSPRRPEVGPRPFVVPSSCLVSCGSACFPCYRVRECGPNTPLSSYAFAPMFSSVFHRHRALLLLSCTCMCSVSEVQLFVVSLYHVHFVLPEYQLVFSHQYQPISRTLRLKQARKFTPNPSAR